MIASVLFSWRPYRFSNYTFNAYMSPIFRYSTKPVITPYIHTQKRAGVLPPPPREYRNTPHLTMKGENPITNTFIDWNLKHNILTNTNFIIGFIVPTVALTAYACQVCTFLATTVGVIRITLTPFYRCLMCLFMTVKVFRTYNSSQIIYIPLSVTQRWAEFPFWVVKLCFVTQLGRAPFCMHPLPIG